MSKQKSQTKLFVAVFVALAILVALQNLMRKKVVLLDVPENAGVSVLETVDTSIVCVFQDGQVGVWDWSMLPTQQGDFTAVSAQAILLGSQHLAAVSSTGKKVLTVYNLPDGQKQKDISVGWEDQELWLRISPDKKTVALVRRNEPDSKGTIRYEFLTIDMDKQVLSLPVTVSIAQDAEDFVDYEVSNNAIMYAVASQDGLGRIVAIDLLKGQIKWDVKFPDTKEFCSCLISPKEDNLYAGNRDGILYKINAENGDINNRIQLLEDGETRPVTNDYSVLNLAFSPDGQDYVATINPKAYVLKTASDQIIHIAKPANRLVSKIAFSPDNEFIVTSDVRAGWPIKIWPIPKQK